MMVRNSAVTMAHIKVLAQAENKAQRSQVDNSRLSNSKIRYGNQDGLEPNWRDINTKNYRDMTRVAQSVDRSVLTADK